MRGHPHDFVMGSQRGGCSMSVVPARIIVCETGSKWAVALRRQLRRDPDAAVRETRSLDDCWQEATASPASVVVLEVTFSNLERVAATLPNHLKKLPRARAVVVGERRLAATEWLMRELGAVHVLFSPRRMSPLVRIIRRHLHRERMAQPSAPVLPWRELPWLKTNDRPERESPVHEPDWLVRAAES